MYLKMALPKIGSSALPRSLVFHAAAQEEKGCDRQASLKLGDHSEPYGRWNVLRHVLPLTVDKWHVNVKMPSSEYALFFLIGCFTIFCPRNSLSNVEI